MNRQSCVGEELLNDLEQLTGLSLTTNESGNMVYEKNHFLFFKWAKVNKKNRSSKAARKYIKKAIKSKTKVTVKLGDSNRRDADNNTLIYYNSDEIHQFMSNVRGGLNPLTTGPALVFIHELEHTPLGSNVKDPPRDPYNHAISDADILGNKIRSEMGEDYGQRLSYNAYYIVEDKTQPFFSKYLPFDADSKSDLEHRYIPSTKCMRFGPFPLNSIIEE